MCADFFDQEADQYAGLAETFGGEEVPPDMQGLVDQTEQEVTPWIAKSAGDRIFGTLVDIGEIESSFGNHKLVPRLIIRTPSQRLAEVRCYATVLEGEIRRRMAMGTLSLGDDIAISYQGIPSGVNYHVYRVSTRHPQ